MLRIVHSLNIPTVKNSKELFREGFGSSDKDFSEENSRDSFLLFTCISVLLVLAHICPDTSITQSQT